MVCVDVSPFPRGYFQVPAVSFRGCKHFGLNKYEENGRKKNLVVSQPGSHEFHDSDFPFRLASGDVGSLDMLALPPSQLGVFFGGLGGDGRIKTGRGQSELYILLLICIYIYIYSYYICRMYL